MMDTMLLDTETWDLTLDADGNIALASDPYALAQDAASAIRTFLGECYFDTTVGVPYLQDILGKSPSLALLKAILEDAAMTVPGVTAAKCFISAVSGRVVEGQVQVTSAETGQTAAATFATINPQGVG